MRNSLTDHAKVRLRQRGIKEEVMFYLQKYGKTSFAPGGAMKISFTRRDKSKLIEDLKKEIQWIEKTCGVIVIEKDGQVLTVYHKN